MTFNILLDELPTEYEGYEMNTDFSVGILIIQAQQDPDLSDIEKVQIISHLLFCKEDDEGNDIGEYPDYKTAMEAASFLLNGWYTDNYIRADKQHHAPSTDYYMDQWRIYAAFLSQYQIDLNTVDYMHYWVFMGLMSNLEECAFNRIANLRTEKLPKKNGMTREQLQRWREQKERYRIYPPGTYTSEEEDDEAVRKFDELTKNVRLSQEEREARIKRAEKEIRAAEAFMKAANIKKRI